MQRRPKRVVPYCRSQFSTLFLLLSGLTREQTSQDTFHYLSHPFWVLISWTMHFNSEKQWGQSKGEFTLLWGKSFYKLHNLPTPSVDLYLKFQKEIDDIKHEAEATDWNSQDWIECKYDNLIRDKPHGKHINPNYSAWMFHDWNDQRLINHKNLQEIVDF